MNTVVWRPRLVGGRFNDHSIPLEILSDLATLEEMIIDVSRWEYLRDHQYKSRLPRGFCKGLSLNLSGIEEGSAIPVLAVFLTASMAVPYVEEAQARIVSAISAAENGEEALNYVPSHILHHFNSIGRNLKDDEYIEFAPENSEYPARYDRTTREKLVSMQNQYQSFVLTGKISRIAQDTNTFTFHASYNIPAPIQEEHREIIVQAVTGYHKDYKVLISGVAFHSRGRIQKIESISHLSFLDVAFCINRLHEFRDIQDGWFEGEGLAPKREGLDWVTKSIALYWNDDMPQPYLYPTGEGGIQAEWSLPNREISLDINLDQHRGHWHDLNIQTGADEMIELDLSDSQGWRWVLQQIKGILGG